MKQDFNEINNELISKYFLLQVKFNTFTTSKIIRI